MIENLEEVINNECRTLKIKKIERNAPIARKKELSVVTDDAVPIPFRYATIHHATDSVRTTVRGLCWY